jgi:hypothetical protein
MSFVSGGGLQPGGQVYLTALYADGNKHQGGPTVPGWPVGFTSIVEFYGSAQDFLTEGSESPLAADVNGDGAAEIAFSPWLSPTYLVRGDGTTIGTFGPTTGTEPGAPVAFTTSGAFGTFGPTLAYLQGGTNGDSVAKLLTPGKAAPITNVLRAYDATTLEPRPNFPQPIVGLPFYTDPVIADVTGDGQAEAIVSADSSTLHAFDLTGSAPAGWPKFTNGWGIFAPSVGDIDHDGKVEVVMTTREGYLFVWNTPGLASANDQWPSGRHDAYNSGNYGTKLKP